MNMMPIYDMYVYLYIYLFIHIYVYGYIIMFIDILICIYIYTLNIYIYMMIYLHILSDIPQFEPISPFAKFRVKHVLPRFESKINTDTLQTRP